MNKSQLISIIITNWNGKKWLKKCLDSFKKQTYKNYEIIFVDNASTDDSLEFVKKKYPLVKIIKNKENYGFSRGNNMGIKNSSGELILLLNNDTWVEKNFLEQLYLQYIKLDIDVLSAHESAYFKSKERLKIKDYIITLDPLGQMLYLKKNKKTSLKKDFYLNGCCLFFSRKFYLETKGLDDDFFMYCEDTDWFWRLNLLNKKFTYANKIYVYHAVGGSSSHGLNYYKFLWINQNNLQMILKNYSLSTLLFILPIYLIENIFEIIFLLIILKPKIASSYIRGWLYNLKILPKTLKKRKYIQSIRKVSDLEIMKKMYFGLAKLYNFSSYLKLIKR